MFKFNSGKSSRTVSLFVVALVMITWVGSDCLRGGVVDSLSNKAPIYTRRGPLRPEMGLWDIIQSAANENSSRFIASDEAQVKKVPTRCGAFKSDFGWLDIIRCKFGG